MSKFTLSLNWKIFFGFCSLFWLALAYHSLSLFQDRNSMDMLMFLLQSLVAAFFAFRMFDTFSINGDGFTYHSLGIEHIGKWSDVKDIDERENFLVDLVRLEGILILKEKLNMKRNWLWLGKAKYFFIPVSQFSTKWRDSELGYRIKEYLPQIEWKKT